MIKTANLTWSNDGRLYNADYDDIYFHPADGVAESDYIFIQQNNLSMRFSNMMARQFTIAETGFGSGLNFILAADLFLKTAQTDKFLHFISFEKHPIKQDDLAKIYQSWPQYRDICDDILTHYPMPVPGFHDVTLCDGRVRLTLCYGDIQDLLSELDGQVDAWFLDGFTPAKNPDMWAEPLFKHIAALSHGDTCFATFTSAGAIRRSLIQHGFDVVKMNGFGKKREIMSGTFKETKASKNKPAEPFYQLAPPVSTGKDITILGAGIAGCSAAYALSKRGIPCTILDASHGPATQTSGNPIGILYPSLTPDENPMGQYYRHGFGFSRHVLAQLHHLDTGFIASGVLHIAENDKTAKRYQNIADYYQKTPDMVHFLSKNAASTKAGINIDKPCLFYPNGGYLSPQKFCQALLTAHNTHITEKYNQNITEIRKTGDKWQLYDQNGYITHETDVLIIAQNGINLKCAALSPFTTRKIRGQVSFVPETPISARIQAVICQNGYIPPAVGGAHYVGATFDPKNITNLSVSGTDHQHNLGILSAINPTLSYTVSDCFGGKVGLRSTTLDKLPYIGAVPNLETLHDYASKCDLTNPRNQRNAPLMDYHTGLYISVGYGSHGMGNAPLAGEIIACQILGEAMPCPKRLLKHVMPQRFALRKYFHQGSATHKS